MIDVNTTIAKVLAGDREAFRAIVIAYQAMLQAIACFRTGNPDLAEEIVQQTFIHAYNDLADFRADGDFGVWLRVLCHYEILSELKRVARDRSNRARYQMELCAQLATEALNVDAQASDEATGALEECLRQLPPTSASLITGKYADGRSVQELATMHGRTVTWVTTTLYRLRLGLRECIERRLPDAAGRESSP